jgi:hypothetical protein
MVDRFYKITDTIDVYGNIETVNSIVIGDIDYWRSNKESIYKLLEDRHLNPAIIHHGNLLKFPDKELLEIVAKDIDLLLENIDNSTTVNENHLKKCSLCGK